MVSVVIPNYNHSDFLEDRIQSILNQTFQDFELILLDDHSNDNSRSIIEQYRGHQKVAHIFYSKKNSGSPFGLWEKGFELAKGEFIWIAESDDVSELYFLETLMANFYDKEVVLSHCKSFNIDEKGQRLHENIWWDSFQSDLLTKDFIRDGKFLLKVYGRFKCPVVNVSSAIFRKSVLEKVVIPNTYKYCGDWWFWSQIFNLGKVGYIARPMNLLRKHLNSATSTNRFNEYNKFKENLKVIRLINSELKEEFRYQENYSWLVEFWICGFKESNFKYRIKYLNVGFPTSFFKIIIKRVIKRLKNR